MQLADREWLLYCRQCREWTGLHRFLPNRGHFQGEHSITLNAFLNSDLLLGKFLLHHADHELVPIPDMTEAYTQIMLHGDRFLDRLIDDLVSDRIQRDQDHEAQKHSERQEVANTLLILKGMYTERLMDLEKQHPDDPGQARVHLGKTLGIEWCREQLDHLAEFRKRF